MNVDILMGSGLCCQIDETDSLRRSDIHMVNMSIIGPPGSGKSTPLRLLADLTGPSDGQLLFTGINQRLASRLALPKGGRL